MELFRYVPSCLTNTGTPWRRHCDTMSAIHCSSQGLYRYFPLSFPLSPPIMIHSISAKSRFGIGASRGSRLRKCIFAGTDVSSSLRYRLFSFSIDHPIVEGLDNYPFINLHQSLIFFKVDLLTNNGEACCPYEQYFMYSFFI